MLTLVITVLLGLGFALFATQNTDPVSVYVGSLAISNIPLYQVILAAIVFTLLISGFIYLLRSLSSSLTISEKDSELTKVKEELGEVTKQAHKLELENTKLKTRLGEEEEDEDSI
jgi:uncharacterized integral membrane protein